MCLPPTRTGEQQCCWGTACCRAASIDTGACRVACLSRTHAASVRCRAGAALPPSRPASASYSLVCAATSVLVVRSAAAVATTRELAAADATALCVVHCCTQCERARAAGIRPYCLTLASNFKAPFLREYCLMYGLRRWGMQLYEGEAHSRRACAAAGAAGRTRTLHRALVAACSMRACVRVLWWQCNEAAECRTGERGAPATAEHQAAQCVRASHGPKQSTHAPLLPAARMCPAAATAARA